MLLFPGLRTSGKGIVVEKPHKNGCPVGGTAIRSCSHSDRSHRRTQPLPGPWTQGQNQGGINPGAPTMSWQTQLATRGERVWGLQSLEVHSSGQGGGVWEWIYEGKGENGQHAFDFIKHLLCATVLNCACVHSVNLHNNPMGKSTNIFLSSAWRNWNLKRLNHLPKATQV